MELSKKLVLVAVVLGVYMYWPPPSLPRNLFDWRTKGDFFKYGDLKIFYRDEPGTALNSHILICLHGFPTASYDWVKVLPELRKKFQRVILLDFIGFGFSSKPVNHKYSLLNQADLVEKLLVTLGITKVHILSHDYGDTVAQELIHRHEARVRAKAIRSLSIESLCMLNGGMFPETNFPSPMQRMLVIPIVGPWLAALTPYRAFQFGLGRVFGTKPTDEDMLDFWSLTRTNNGHLVIHLLLGYMAERWRHRDRFVNALRDTSVPIHTIYGPADVINPPETFVAFYRETLPNAGLSVLDEAVGHYPQWEAPSVVITEYYKFLETVGV